MKNLRNTIMTASLTLCLLGMGSGLASAFNGIARDWRDQYPDACPTLTAASQDCTLCHVEGAFYDLNDYGSDLADANRNFLVIEGIDSDGDGRTNGQEINLDCTLPGDPESVPAEFVLWGQIKALYR